MNTLHNFSNFSEASEREDDSESSDAESESGCSSECEDEEERGKRECTLYILINLTGRVSGIHFTGNS